jgi:hypothetical protein
MAAYTNEYSVLREPRIVAANLPPEKLAALRKVVDRLCGIPNMAAVVLGGSYAAQCATSESDLDLGLYYRRASPFPIEQVRAVAESIAVPGSAPTVTDFYGWGPWVNGGAWIQTSAGKVDLIYRNIEQVAEVIEQGRLGVWSHDYDQQPPYGFRSVIYFGETHICVPLHDPDGEIARLKESVATYPIALRNRVVQDSLWGAEFSLWSCRNFAKGADVYGAAGCLTRVAQYLIQALFAMNGEYFVNDKHAKRTVAGFAAQPQNFNCRLAAALAQPGANPDELSRSADLMTALWREAYELTEGAYKPRFCLE